MDVILTKNGGTTDGREVDDLLSKELMKMNFNDRNSINEEIHGVRCLAPVETPEFLQYKLNELQKELDLTYYKPSYDKAQELASSKNVSCYINLDGFRLKFLRCELFDSKLACVRMVHYLDLLVELYGTYALERPIRLSDFTRSEMQIFRAGYFQ